MQSSPGVVCRTMESRRPPHSGRPMAECNADAGPERRDVCLISISQTCRPQFLSSFDCNPPIWRPLARKEGGSLVLQSWPIFDTTWASVCLLHEKPQVYTQHRQYPVELAQGAQQITNDSIVLVYKTTERRKAFWVSPSVATLKNRPGVESSLIRNKHDLNETPIPPFRLPPADEDEKGANKQSQNRKTLAAVGHPPSILITAPRLLKRRSH